MIEVLNNAEMAEADRLTIAGGMTGFTLMENAGEAVAQAVCARQSPGARVAVLAGPGNNGGDGFVAARLLAERGYAVVAMLVGAVRRQNLRNSQALTSSSTRCLAPAWTAQSAVWRSQ
jgi:hydroxyethylthiazole kinase-like uncharacterized protein yjeF